MNAPLVYRRLWPYLKPYKVRFLIGFVFGLVYAATDGAMLLLLENVLKRVFADQGRNYSLLQILLFSLLIPAIFLVRGVCDFLNKYCISWVGLRAVMDLRNRLFAHIHTLSLDFFNRMPVGDLVSRITNDAVFAQRAVSGATSDLFKEPFVFLVLIGVLISRDWAFTLAVMILFPLCLFPVLVYGRRVRQSTKSSQQNLAELVALLNESFAGVRIVKAYSMEQAEVERFQKSSRRLFRHVLRVVMSGEILAPIIEMITALGLVAAFLYAFKTDMDWKTFLVIGVGLLRCYNPIKKLSKVHVTLESAGAAIDRIYQILDVQPTVVVKPQAQTLAPIQQQIEFDHVSFRYDSIEVLDDVHFVVRKGTLVAVVGPSGSGKTTLINLIPRFFDVGGGAIRIDGVDIRDVTIESLRRQIALVTQEVILFDDTVVNNIALGRPGATREEIVEAARRAHADEFVAKMPQGYDSEIGERGVRLSGGQRQRLAIARAILKNAPILILDEATSSLDSESEHAVQEALDDLMQHRTSFVIAHRLSTVQHADLIVVIDQGHIVESGRHADLLALGGTYKRLYDMQFKD